MVQQPKRAFAVWLFWDATDWSFAGYYVNLQAPLVSTSVGFDTADHLLDIVVAPELAWEWKDEDEFEEALAHGVLSMEIAAEARDAAERAVADIDARNWPFDSSLIDWRPDPNWRIPVLPDNWNEGF
jgi:predicted RNA-binding protein associated with RNAse of E/G family